MKLFSRKNNEKTEKWNIRTMFGPNMNFAATEAFKVLRTNLMFSFSNEGKGYVIGITSAVQNEGKSSTACNIAYVLAESGAKVLLLEADLRKPTIASKLVLAKTPGLTNLLVSTQEYGDVVQHCAAAEGMDIITSGDIPPNPSELLTSGRMQRLLEQLKEKYDYIIVDLPPVNVVSDAIAISRFLDGILLVVRNEYSDKKCLTEAMRQLSMVDVRILGFVYRDTYLAKKKYGYRYRYGSRYYKYRYKYYSSYYGKK